MIEDVEISIGNIQLKRLGNGGDVLIGYKDENGMRHETTIKQVELLALSGILKTFSKMAYYE